MSKTQNPPEPEPTENHVVDAQGCIILELGGQAYTLRPSYRAIQNIERETGRSLFSLANVSVHSCLALDDMTTIVVEMWKAYGATLPDNDPLASTYRAPNPERVGTLLYDYGTVKANSRIGIVLMGAATGGYNAQGEPKATGNKS